MYGDLNSALQFCDVLLCTKQPPAVIHRLLLGLLRALPFVQDKARAQQCCRTAAQLFSRWKDIREKLTRADIDDMVQRVAMLERAVSASCCWLVAHAAVVLVIQHNKLRRATIINWNQGSVPGPHLQTLLELVLAARRAVPGDLSDSSAHARTRSVAQ